MSIKDNIRFGNIEASDQDVINAAKKAFIHDDISRLPKSYETVLNEKGNNLSGGQKQRIALARIFLRNPDIVFMDEATSALDYETEIGIVKSIEKEFKNRIVITVAHRLETIKEYDRILYIDEGKIMLDGNYQYLLENKLFHEFLRS